MRCGRMHVSTPAVASTVIDCHGLGGYRSNNGGWGEGASQWRNPPTAVGREAGIVKGEADMVVR